MTAIRQDWQYVYGPVPSRRLGRSLGVSPIPPKTCNYSCVYCQLGRTTRLTPRRERFFPPARILEELRQALALHGDAIDYVTFVGEGEPTLSLDLGLLVRAARQLCSGPVATITNGYLLSDAAVRRELTPCDVVMPSLDTVREETFHRLDRPWGRLTAAALVDGLRRFRQVYAGDLWVEVMLVRGLNDTEAELTALRAVLDEVAPERVYMNLPLRPPAEPWAEPPDAAGRVRAAAILGDAVVIEGPEQGDFGMAGFAEPMDGVVATARRHPMRREQIVAAIGAGVDVEGQLAARVARGDLRVVSYHGVDYYAASGGTFPREP